MPEVSGLCANVSDTRMDPGGLAISSDYTVHHNYHTRHVRTVKCEKKWHLFTVASSKLVADHAAAGVGVLFCLSVCLCRLHFGSCVLLRGYLESVPVGFSWVQF